MKKIFNFLKTLLCGLVPALAGGMIFIDIKYIIYNIHKIATGSGWIVVYYFILTFVEFILAICLLYDIGIINRNSKDWIQHKKACIDNTISGSSLENETSDEVADISPDFE
jgi:cytochrome b subunit of formate dehydrogenase